MASPALWPDCCRLVEAIFIRLCRIHKSPRRKGKSSSTRWTLILHDYGTIRQLLLNNGPIMQNTNLQLVEVNQATLVQWHNEKIRVFCCRASIFLLLYLLPLSLSHLPAFGLLHLRGVSPPCSLKKQLRWLEQNYYPRGCCFLCLKALWDQSRFLQLGSALLLPVCLNQTLLSLCMLSLRPQQTLF